MSINQVGDQEANREFADRMVALLADSSVAVLISIGYQVGLFEVMAAGAPATSAQIASAAGLDERYVREWLGAMATGRIVDYHADSMTFSLPSERAAILTDRPGSTNLAQMCQYIAFFGEVEQRIVHCFREGGGVPYSEFSRLHAVMAQRSAAVFDAGLVDVVLPAVDGLPELLRAGVEVADFGCGRGHAVNLMARQFPASRFTGYDISADSTAAGRTAAARMGLPNAVFVEEDLAEISVTQSYDVITAFDAIHDQAAPAAVLRNIHRALRPQGVLLMVDIKASSHLEHNIGHPLAPFLYTVSTMHCMTGSLSGGGAGLGAMWGQELAVTMLADAGFSNVLIKGVESDPLNNYYIARP